MNENKKRIWLYTWINNHRAFDIEEVDEQDFRHFFDLIIDILNSFEELLKNEKLKNTQRNEN